MILGVGTDILHRSRLLPENLRPEDPFFRKVFTPSEQRQGMSGPDPFGWFAGRFSCKEAVFKALGVDPDSVRLTDIEILDGPDGIPRCTLSGPLGDSVRARGGRRVHVSISAEGETVLSAAVLEAEDTQPNN